MSDYNPLDLELEDYIDDTEWPSCDYCGEPLHVYTIHEKEIYLCPNCEGEDEGPL